MVFNKWMDGWMESCCSCRTWPNAQLYFSVSLFIRWATHGDDGELNGIAAVILILMELITETRCCPPASVFIFKFCSIYCSKDTVRRSLRRWGWIGSLTPSSRSSGTKYKMLYRWFTSRFVRDISYCSSPPPLPPPPHLFLGVHVSTFGLHCCFSLFLLHFLHSTQHLHNPRGN